MSTENDSRAVHMGEPSVRSEPVPEQVPSPVPVAARPLSSLEHTAYVALRSHAVWWDSTLVWSRWHGDKAVEALNGLITNDVAALANGHGLYAAALSPKGKLVADMFVVRVDDTTLLVAVERDVAPAWLALARKYVNPRLCKVTDESAQLHTWTVYGVNAEMATNAIYAACVTAPQFFKAPDMHGVPGFFVVADTTNSEQMARIRASLNSGMASHGSDTVWNLIRVESGRPKMGIDMDENTIPQEANLDALDGISFTKGCYTGQETVARIYFRGHVNKHLRGLRSAEPLVQGAELADENGKVVGRVKSVAISPSLGSIALAMVRREVAIGSNVTVQGPPGSSVTVQGQSGSTVATVLSLPFTMS